MTASGEFKDHFSGQAAAYAAHRPTYPRALVDFLADMSPQQTVALDCGCGTGQLSTLLADRFAAVVATDASAAQIANATPHPKVIYKTAPAERSGLPDASVDLVTVAQAAHWLDLDAFYAEVRRIAVPRAVAALITYGVLHLDSDAEAVVQHFYHDAIGSYWPPERSHVEDGYRRLAFPFAEIAAPAMAIEVSWRLADVVGYVSTWSAVAAARKTLGDAPLETFQTALVKVWGDPNAPKTVRWPLSLRVARI